MITSTSRWRWMFALLASSLVLILGAQPAQATTFSPLVGEGSSWAQPAIAQWSRDVYNRGIRIDFSGSGSASGRQKYIQGQVDFAASDIAFQTTADPFGGGLEQSAYSYSYVPIVAGGTSFLYNLVVGGKHVTNMRLSGATLAKIFTGQVTNWSDKAITADYGAQLPSQKITVVGRSDGSGASYMFTRWMAKQYSSIWTPFCKAQGGQGACGATEFYPGFSGSVQRLGSDQVASYVSSPSFGPGSIGYDEYAYALASNIPVVKVLNAAGYYSAPTASNVAIALQAASIDNNEQSLTFLIQNLDKVYTNPDSRSYPLSSYSYLIVPRDSRTIGGNTYKPPPRFDTNKGATLSTWMNYVLCGAQQKAGQLGYSPLPKNLVVGGFNQIDHVPGHVPTPDLVQLNGCNNPTYSNGVNHLIVDAPKPSPCDKVGSPLNCVVAGGKPVKKPGSGITTDNNTSSNGTTNGTGSSRTNTTNGTGTTKNGTNGSTTGTRSTNGGTTGTRSTNSGTNATLTTGNSGTTLDALGNPVAQGGGDAANGGAGDAGAVPVSLASHSNQSWTLSTLTTLDIVAAIVLPGLFGAWLRRRKRADG